MPRLVSRFFLACVPLVLAAGCGREVSNAELGKCLWGIPDVPGSQERYELPEPPKSAVPDPYEQELNARRASTAGAGHSHGKTDPQDGSSAPHKH